ncbi:hypothetical protein O7626_02535 [Micromonospora sp. WMMD1102]|uniref:hypothetical protein n=1 Tax=Micromonospora sp. WMMD1102 TaxID=3016105 RepID=UPI002414FC2D|nr:hypothetical protein [Micromonospora sp. WMMD1102]MDG4784820.1 hypothetical protein [Micromonospora sp. WMMD1102]
MSRVGRLDEAAWGLVHEALEVYGNDPRAVEQLHRQFTRFEEPLRIAVAGPWRSGKSTLVNAVMGEAVAPVEVADGRQVFTWYEDGPEPRVTAYPANGAPRDLAVTRTSSGMRVDLGGGRWDQVDDIVVQWPTRALRHAVLIDTPAAASGVEARTASPGSRDGSGRPAIGAGPTAGGDAQLVGGAGAAATVQRIVREADAVLYLSRDGSGDDLPAFQAAQSGSVARAAPVNVLLVLSRVDELAGGRVDALLTARQLARRHRRDPRVSARCLSVVAVGGLVALAGRMLSESEYAALAALAGLPRAETDRLLLSTDRFLAADFPIPLDLETRRRLLDRLGIFGVRLSTTLVRTGSDSRARLAAELVRRSGLTELRESMTRYFVDRAPVFKARAVLMALESLLRSEPRPGAAELLARLEQVLAGAHEFRELRLSAALLGGQLRFDPELSAEAQRLIGGDGASLAARLGVEHDATGDELWARGSTAVRRWQDLAEDPLRGVDQRRAARVVVRSCEGILAELS